MLIGASTGAPYSPPAWRRLTLVCRSLCRMLFTAYRNPIRCEAKRKVDPAELLGVRRHQVLVLRERASLAARIPDDEDTVKDHRSVGTSTRVRLP